MIFFEEITKPLSYQKFQRMNHLSKTSHICIDDAKEISENVCRTNS